MSSKQYEQGYKVEGFTIRGVAGSAAEKYAKENGFTFEAMKPDYIKGDSDSDGKVTISDVRTTLRYVCQKVGVGRGAETCRRCGKGRSYKH